MSQYRKLAELPTYFSINTDSKSIKFESNNVTINPSNVEPRTTAGQLRFVGPDSDLIHSLQDGSGRYNIYWNCSGTPTPTYLVSNEPSVRLLLHTDPTTNTGQISFFGAPSGVTSNTITYNQIFLASVGANSSTNNYIWMSPRGNSTDFYLVANGNVGIGKTTADYKLDVNGYIYATSTDSSMSRIGLTNANRHWTISNYGTSFSPNGTFAIADETGGVVRMNISTTGVITFNGSVFPSSSNTHDLGTSSLRWRNIYTNDLHLNNGIGDYTIVEGEDDLFLYNNKKGKVYKFALIEVDSAEAPAKAT